jgi:hypothetical protein
MADYPESKIDSLLMESLRKGRRATWRIASGSMAPLIEAGDSVTIEPVSEGGALRVGDVVLIRADDKWIVHRLVGKVKLADSVYFRQKGDAGLRAQSIPPSAIYGRVVLVDKVRGNIDLTTFRRRLLNRSLGLFLNLVDRLIRRDDRSSANRGGPQNGLLRRSLTGPARLLKRAVTRVAVALLRL